MTVNALPAKETELDVLLKSLREQRRKPDPTYILKVSGVTSAQA